MWICWSQAAPVQPGWHDPQLKPEKFPLHLQVWLKKRKGQCSRSSRPSCMYCGPWGRESAITGIHWPLPEDEPQRSEPGTDNGDKSGQHSPLTRASTVAHWRGNWALAWLSKVRNCGKKRSSCMEICIMTIKVRGKPEVPLVSLQLCLLPS